MELDTIDHLFAEHWLGGEKRGQEFLAQLLASARAGHLCLYAEEGPKLPSHLVYVGEEAYPKEPVVRCGNAYYLQRHWAAETEVVRALQKLMKSTPRLPLSLDPEGVTEEQKGAIRKVAKHALTLLTGGPGTGKTYTAAQLIQAVLRADPSHRIALAAPTGKAVGNLEGSLRKLLGDRTPEVKTLHSLLKRRAGKIRAEEKLTADLVLVDEASMVDVGMMATLLTAIRPGARLVLMGDADQLPPVEAGSLFADMVSCGGQYVAELRRCLRVETESLVQLAAGVKEGHADFDIQPLSKETLIQQVAPQFPNPFVEDVSKSSPHAFMDFRLLAPIRKGPFGVDGLNALFHSHFKQKRPPGHAMLTPIMVTKNAHSLSLYNGEVGVLVEFDGEEDYALFPARSGPGPRKIPRYALPPFEVAYCLSVHKSQGSEFDKVAFVLSPGSEIFGRELFYTALTRAKRSFELFGSPEVLQLMVAKQNKRLSQLSSRLSL